MLDIKRIGVFLKNTHIDDAVLAFAAHIGRDPARRLFIAHVSNPDDPETPPTPTAEAFDQTTRARLPDIAATSLETAVLKGNQIEQILRAARDQDLDLMVLGRRLPSSQIGLGAKIARIVRKSPCSVLIVPDLCQPHFDRILAGVDCSDHSRDALEAAVQIARTAPGQRQVTAVNVRNIPHGYDVAGITFVEAAERQRQRGMENLRQFIDKTDTDGVSVEPLVLLSEDPALAMTHAAMAKKMDIVIVGSRGSSGTAAALMGTTSERLLMTCATPTLIIKRKGETLSLLEALFGM
ncbi:MAG TPA: universal stress protein [Phycisphaerae bacterium]|nr:universal stress protein [Phycisphaerae bacterium]HRW53845.1 universal stress protein [Phycisphaerae bacterium]